MMKHMGSDAMRYAGLNEGPEGATRGFRACGARIYGTGIPNLLLCSTYFMYTAAGHTPGSAFSFYISGVLEKLTENKKH